MKGYFLLIGLVSVLSVLALMIIRRRRRHAPTVTYDEVAAWTEPFILFLRDFQADNRGEPLPFSLFTLLTPPPLTYEGEVLGSLTKRWRVVAVGSPEEDLPPLGALRLYVDGENWKSVVSALMERAHRIVFKPGRSAGVRWELEHAIESGHLARLVMYHRVGEVDRDDLQRVYYERIRTRLNEAGVGMMPYDSNRRVSYFPGGKTHASARRVDEVPGFESLGEPGEGDLAP